MCFLLGFVSRHRQHNTLTFSLIAHAGRHYRRPAFSSLSPLRASISINPLILSIFAQT